jgi:N-acetylmuramoyl-L-alanine amidase
VSALVGVLGAPAFGAQAPAPSLQAQPLLGRTIVVDPGHNGGNANAPQIINRLVPAGQGQVKACNTTGTATASGYDEAAFNWDVAKRLRALLTAAGARVVMTRQNNSGVGPCVNERAAIGNRAHADAVIAIHADGGPSSGRGFQVIYPPDVGDTVPIFDASRALAHAVHDALVASRLLPPSTYVGQDGYSVRDDLAGLNLSSRPAIFVELGNMQNSTDARVQMSPGFRQRLAATLRTGLEGFLGARTYTPRRVLIGRSVDRRPIVAWSIGPNSATRKVLVVGCIHGNECAGLSITSALRHVPVPDGVQLWLLPEANPDGTALATRQNAHGVDVNRNFPYRWQPASDPTFNSGPHAASEPETRAVMSLVRRLRPAVSIWYHQAMDLVDTPAGDRGVPRGYAQIAGLRDACLTLLPGVETGWSDHTVPGTNSFVVELPAGAVSAAALRRHLAAVQAMELNQRSGSRTRCDSVVTAT